MSYIPLQTRTQLVSQFQEEWDLLLNTTLYPQPVSRQWYIWLNAYQPEIISQSLGVIAAKLMAAENREPGVPQFGDADLLSYITGIMRNLQSAKHTVADHA